MTFAPFSVSVPATAANLGPGYDSCGIALELRDLVRVAPAGPGERTRVSVTGEGEDTLPRDETHLVVRVIHETLASLGRPDVQGLALRLDCENVIPHSRGLGSSAAAVVAGITAGYVIAGRERVAAEILARAVAYEGHPDNAAPAIRGGASLSICGDAPVSVDLAVHPSVQALALVPSATLSTAVARALLPAEVPHAVAAENSARVGLLVHALAAGTHLFEGTADLLHQEARRTAMPGTLAVVDALRASGLAAFVSGAGPTVTVFGVGDLAAAVGAALPEAMAREYAVRPLAVASEGARVCYT